MPPAAIALAALQTISVIAEMLARHQAGVIDDQELEEEWSVMKVRLGAVSERIQSNPRPASSDGD